MDDATILSTYLDNVKISILIAYYERPTFLNLIVHNISTQSFVKKYSENVEIVIIDDSSDKYTLDHTLFKKKLKKHGITSIQYIRQPSDQKYTIGQKRNKLCEVATHPVLIFMDDDDYYFPTYITYSLYEMLRYHKQMVGSNSMLFYYTHRPDVRMSINCMSPRQIHEATMCFLKSHWQKYKFNEQGYGEGASMIDGHEETVSSKLDITKLMVCVCHAKNTCNKIYFIDKGINAVYTIPDKVINLINEATTDPLYSTRRKICFKYPTRERPEQFIKQMKTYMSMLSNVHDYMFCITMDTDDTSMNNDTIRTFIETEVKPLYPVFYKYDTSTSKIHAINRDMLAPTFDILFLISDDMVPVVHGFDDRIVKDFEKYFPDFDGMLNYNDGLRPDWPKICTLTIYGKMYYNRFNYIYHPDYTSVYCDQEQTDVGRLLNKIQDINTVIVQHKWTDPDVNDSLRKRTEDPEMYKKDLEVYTKRSAISFEINNNTNTNTQNNTSLQVLSASCPIRLCILIYRYGNIPEENAARNLEKIRQVLIASRYNREIEVSYANNNNSSIISSFYNLLHHIQGKENTSTSYFTFLNICTDTFTEEYINTIFECMNKGINEDVFCYYQECIVKGKKLFTVDPDLIHTIDEDVTLNNTKNNTDVVLKRRIWNWCTFHSKFNKLSYFDNIKDHNDSYAWLSRITPDIVSQYKIEKCLISFNI
jgi:hypothetical protein